ncbi:hypothetical protein H0E87_023914 [Populus deltoides]|uniref:Glycosyltransferase n=1 Tax=Populus deltoides TaxID=3696 RepID=A0A8T2X6K2_POPDE|nr:hypothetical protein H0E87_023914 [Populus deltoides]
MSVCKPKNTGATANTSTMKRAQLVFVPCPGIGHLVSTVGFAKLILERTENFLITMLVINHPYDPSVNSYVESLVATHTQIKSITIPAIAAPPVEALTEKVFTQFIRDHSPLVRDAIVNQVIANSPAPVASVIVDLFCACFIDVAKELGVPSCVFFCSDAAFYGLTVYLSEREDGGQPKFRESDLDYTIPSYANPVPYRVLPLVHRDQAYETFGALGRKYKESNGVIINTFSELESHAVNTLVARDDLPSIFTVGPLIDHKGKGLSGSEAAKRDEIMKWLDDQHENSVVFLCFGSQGAFREEQLKEIRDCDWAGAQWSTVLVGRSQATLTRRDYARLCGWAPQVEVLAHRAVGAFVSHCGWNSTLESLWYGVPIITWPYYGEQQINAFQLVKDLGLAVELTLDFRRDCSTDFVKAEDITKAVKYMMEQGSEYRDKAKATGEIAKQVLLEGGSSYVAFGRLIEQWLGNKL